MGWQVVFSARSKHDLRGIVEYIARDSPAAAERFGQTLIRQAESLAEAPEMGIPTPARRGTRYLPYRSYLVFYRLDVGRLTVRILRFWHGARGKRPSR
jgi:plasmid stabilization system protein ParE